MPDVGVLSLQIQSDASQATQSLKQLVGALRSIDKIIGQATSGMTAFASSMKAVEKAVGDSKGYLTLSRIATSIEKVKNASQGFKLPDFTRLESLMRSLQDNFNAESGLKRIAEGMEAIKAASQGFKMPSTKEMEKIAFATSNSSAGKSASGTESGFARVDSVVREVGNTTKEITDNTDTGNLPSIVGQYETMEELCRRIAEEKERANIAQQESVRLAEQEVLERMRLAKEALDQQKANQKAAMSTINEGYGTGSIRELYASTTGFGPALRGELGGKEKYAAISAVSEGTGLSKGEIIRQIVELGDEARKAKQQVNELTDSLNKPIDMGNLSQGVDRMLGIGAQAKSGEQSGSAFTSVPAAQQIQALMDRLNQPIDWKWLSQGIDQMNGIGQASLNAEQYLARFLELLQGDSQTAANLREANPELVKFSQELKDAGVEAKDFNSNLVDVDGELKQKKPDAEEAASGFERFKDAVSEVKKVIKGSWLYKLGKQFANIAKRMAIRAVIKQITGAFKEGVESVYHYSEAIGSSFAPAMDQTASLLKQMKNSIGAALAPAIQAVLPIINQLVNAFIEAVNWVNQFFALLNGQSTWTKALPVTAKAFEDQKKKTKGASDAMKDLLADWDELNIIQSQGSGSGSGSANATEDYASMFTQVATFDQSARDVANVVRDVIGFVKENFGFILGAALGVKAAMKAWKLSSALSSSLPFLSKLLGGLAIAATIGLTIAITDLTGKNFIATGSPGWLIADALTGAVGATLAGSLAQKLIGGTAGTVTAGFTLILAGLTNVKNAVSAFSQKKDAEGWMLGALGAIEEGIGAGLLIKGLGLSGFSLAGGAVVALGALAITLACSVALAEDAIEWGTVDLTPEQVRTKVQTDFFTGIDVEATINLVKATIDKVTVTKDELEAQIAETIPILTTLKLGINDETTYNDLKKAIFGDATTKGIIGKVQDYATANVQELKTSISLIPIVNSSGEDVSSEFLSKGIEGWDEVTRYTNQIGQDLAKELSKGFTEDGLANFDEDAVKAMTEKLVRISKIVTGAQMEAAAESQLSIDLSNIKVKDMNQETVHEVAKVFSNYKGELRKEYEMIYKEAATQYLTLSRFYAEMANDAKTDEEKNRWLNKATEYKDMYDEAVANMEANVTGAVERAAAPGVEQMRDFLQEKFAKEFNKLSVNFDWNGEKSGTGAFWDVIGNPDYGVDTAKDPTKSLAENAKAWNSALAGFLGNENVYLKGLLAEMPEINVWSLMTEQMQEDFKQVLTARYGEKYANELIQQWVGSVPEVASEAVEEAKAEVARMEAETSETADVPTVANEAQETLKETADAVETVSESAVEAKKNVVALDEMSFDTKGVETSADTAATAIEEMAKRIRDAFATLDGLTYEMDISGQKYSGAMSVLIPNIQQRAMGGFVRSGDLVMANENGQFEMMGKMGNQPVVANNQQIISGISQGVAQANGGVESRLNTIEMLLNRIMQKEFVARAVPGSDWGNHNAKSNDAYSRVTG